MTSPAPEQHPTSTPRPTARRSPSTDLALIAALAAIVAVCAILPAIPFGGVGVPFTLQVFGVFLAGAVLGPWRGFLAVLLYLAVGTAGLPVFTLGTGGPAAWAGTTVGYLVAFPVAALLVGAAARLLVRRRPTTFVIGTSLAAAATTLLVVTPLGALGIGWRLGLGAGEALTLASPYVLADLVKGVLAAVVAGAVHRAYPRVLGR
jgi:biotin transport system substrate-specific component